VVHTGVWFTTSETGHKAIAGPLGDRGTDFMAQRQRPAPSDLALHPMNEAMLPPDTDLKLSISPSPRPTLIDKQSASGTSPRISVSLDPNDYGRLSELARNSQRSVGWVIRYAVKRFLADGQDPQLQLPLQGAATPFIHKSIDPNGAIADLSAINWQHLRRRHSWTAHHVHPYPTRFAPEVPAKLIEILSQPGNTVLDPYCGSGTTLLVLDFTLS
jgi:hypothetical protein